MVRTVTAAQSGHSAGRGGRGEWGRAAASETARVCRACHSKDLEAVMLMNDIGIVQGMGRLINVCQVV